MVAVASLVSTSLSYSSLSLTAQKGGESEDAEKKSGPLASAEAYVRDGQKLLKKLDKALDRLRNDDDDHRHGRRRGADEGRKVGYDRNGLLPGANGLLGGDKSSASLSLETASIEQTEISIGPDGISYQQASLSYGHVETDRGTLDVVSLSVTKAYIGFGSQDGASTEVTA